MRIRSIEILVGLKGTEFILTKEDNSVWRTNFENPAHGESIELYPDGLLPPWNEDESGEKMTEAFEWGADRPLAMIDHPEELPSEELLERAGYSDEEIQAHIGASEAESWAKSARKLGMSEEEIQAFLDNSSQEEEPTPPSSDELEKAQLQQDLKD